MPFTVSYNIVEHIINVKIEGIVTNELITHLYTAISTLAFENQCNLVITDCRNATFEMSPTDTYFATDLFKKIYEKANHSIFRIKRAVVISQDVAKYHFYETVNINRGNDIRLFFDETEAKKWLLAKTLPIS